MDSVLSIFGEQSLRAILNDGTSGDDADKSVLVIYNGDKVLMDCPIHQIVHGSGDPDGNVISSPEDLHDPMGFSLPHIHVAKVLDGPEQITFRQCTAILAPLIENGKGRVAGRFHLLQGLPHGKIVA